MKLEFKPRWAAGGIAVAAVLAYGNSFGGAFVFDDPTSIADNPTIRSLAGALRPPAGGLTVSGRPLLNLSLALNYAVSGTDVWSYHALNLLIHLLAGWTLFGIVRRTLERPAGPQPAIGGDEAGAGLVAFAAALIWTVHPLQTESVTYLVQRAESLMGLFYLLTLYGFVRWARPDPAPRGPPEALWGWLSVVACLCGMATKEVMATAPVLVLLYDRAFVSGTFREAWRRRRAYYLGLAAGWLLLGSLVAAAGSRGGTAGFGIGQSWSRYWLAQFPAILHYLLLAVWPHPLVIDYGTPWVQGVGAAVPAVLAVTALAAAAAWAFRRKGTAAAGGFLGLCFFAILAPTSLVPGGRQVLAEHRMYLPLASVATAAAFVLWRLLGSSPVRFLAAVLALACGLGFATASRNADYGDSLALWRGAVAAHPENGFAHDDLGTAWLKLGRLESAEAEYREAVRLEPGYSQGHYNLGNVLEQLHRLPEAESQFEQALDLYPALKDAHAHLGSLLLHRGLLDGAIGHFEDALRLDPASADEHGNLAVALAQAGRRAEAQAQFSTALSLNPHSTRAHFNCGNFLAASGRQAEAIAQYQAAVGIDPGYQEARVNLAIAFAQAGRLDEAVGQFQEALRLDPGSAALHFNLGNALLEAGRLREAQSQFREALRLDPSNEAARNNAARLDALLLFQR